MSRPPAEAGFALIIVLWTVVLLTLLVTQIERAGQSESRLALNLRGAAALQAEADGAIALGAFHLIPGAAPAWAADGQLRVVRVADDAFTDRVVLRIEDEAGEVDLNTAPAPLLQALLAAVGADPTSAAKIAAAILTWRFPAGQGAAVAAVAAPYKAAGLDYGPPSAPFQSLDELRLVLGMTPGLLAALTPHLTLFQESGIDPTLADPVVKRALAAANAFLPNAGPRTGGALQVVSITATAFGSGGSFTRQAIVRVGPQKSGWMQILAWTRPAA